MRQDLYVKHYFKHFYTFLAKTSNDAFYDKFTNYVI